MIPDLARTAVARRIMRGRRDEVAMHDRRLAVFGLLLLLAPLYFVSASLLKYGIGSMFDLLEVLLSVAGRYSTWSRPSYSSVGCVSRWRSTPTPSDG